MNATGRFWYGYVGSSRSGTIVLWDRAGPRAPAGSVYLFHFKRGEIVLFSRQTARSAARPLDEAELSLASSVRSEYFAARARFYEEHPEQNVWAEELPVGQSICFACAGELYEHDETGEKFVCGVCSGSGILGG